MYKKIKPEEYNQYSRCIADMYYGAVYPYSIVEGFQHGEIFSNSRSVLFWHYCGFAIFSGEYSKDFLDFVSDIMMNTDRRFILFTNDAPVENYFRKIENAVIEKRLFFDYGKDVPPEIPRLPDGFELCEINAELLKKIRGNITPYFSWDSEESLLEKGKGYCVVKGDTVAAWAFSAAVSSKEIDIGIEQAANTAVSGLRKSLRKR